MNFWGLLLATFIVTLDASALELVLPQLAVSLDASLEQASLIATCYLLALNLMMVPAVVATRRFEAKTVFNCGLALLLMGSVLSAIAWRIEPMLFGRMVMGAGAGTLAGVSSIIVYQNTQPHQRHAVFASIGTVIGLAYLIGPPLGGILFQTVGTPAIFLSSVPLILLVSLWRMPTQNKVSPAARVNVQRAIDWKELAAITMLIAGLFVLLQPSKNLLGQGEWRVLGLGCMLAGVYFMWWLNRSASDPAVDLNLFVYNRKFTSIVIGSFASYAGAFVIAFITPFYVTNAMGLNALELGLLLTTFPLGFLIGSNLGGIVSARLGPRNATLLSQALVVFSTVPMLLLDGASPGWQIGAASILVGTARGLFVTPIILYGMEVVAEHQIPQVGALLGLVRNMGALLGMLCASALFAALLGGMPIAEVRATTPQHLFTSFRLVYVASFAWATLALLIIAWPALSNGNKTPAKMEADVGF